jgi:hypothetical protein
MPTRRQKSGTAAANARKAKSALAQPDSKQAEELMDLAVDAARSRHLPDFLKRFSTRAASLANADWGGVVVFEENGEEFYSTSNLADLRNAPTRDWLVSRALEINGDAQVCILPQEKSSTCVFVPILSSSKERMGALCLLRSPRALHVHERRLL